MSETEAAKPTLEPARNLSQKTSATKHKVVNRKHKKNGNLPAGSLAGNTQNKQRRPYPASTLEEALKIAQAIKEHNNGNPWDTELVSKASLNVKSSNNRFFYAAAASRDYGLTIGGRGSEKVELTELGRRVVFAKSEEDRQQALTDSFFNVEIFFRVYKHYSGSKALPTNQEFLSNALSTEFQLPKDSHEEFVEIFKKNCKFLGIEDGLGTRTQRERPSEKEVAQSSDVRVVGEPKGKFDRVAFVIMPFSEKGKDVRATGYFKEVLEGLITPAANAAGFAVETANQQGSDVIQSTIIGKLLAADLVIADLTDHNPNVLFELGVRLTKELPVAIIKAEGTGPVFDVDNMLRVNKYNPNLWASTVKADIPKLAEHIKASWDNAETSPNYMQILTGST